LIFPEGAIFTKKYFSILQQIMKGSGDKYFELIEDIEMEYLTPDSCINRFVYPVGISWEEFFESGGIFSNHLQLLDRNYFVFGDSGTWGEYVCNGYSYDNHPGPIDFIGYQEKNEGMILNDLVPLLSKEEKDTMLKMSPENYRQYFRWKNQ
jgi:hypothetical protein